jgi:hypothetical protein
MKSGSGIRSSRKVHLISLFLVLILTAFALPAMSAGAQDEEPEFTRDFRLEDCEFQTRGVNPYFILEPGYQLVLEGEEEGATVRIEITVLDKTKTVNLPGIGKIKTRVVEERETSDGEPVETSRNFFAICDKTNDVYYFGEQVDIFNEDGTLSHEGAWQAGKPDENGLAEPGLIMPGTFLLGSRYYQEIAEGIALDRAEHTAMGLEVTVPAGTFTDCVRVTETTPLEPGSESEKIYCPGIGLVSDDPVELISYGFVDSDSAEEQDDDHE